MLTRVGGWLVAVVAATCLTGCTDEQAAAPTHPEPTDTAATPSSEAAPREEPEQAHEPAVRRPRTAKQALATLVASERAIADPATRPRALVRAARAQQLAYRALGAHPAWDATVRAGLPRSLRGVVGDNVASRREFRAMHSVLSDELPAWRIVAPARADELLRLYRRAERAHGIGWEYLAAINLVETAMGRIRGTSVAGAQGPMQFLPRTWERWGRGDIEDPADSIMAAARYLAHDGGARGRLPQALFRYNNSDHYVRGVTLLAQVMERRPRAFYGYYHWDVYYLTTRGDVRLPVGYDRARPVPVERWLATHPQR
ncbi:transglycosylase SLT domain-containing protein [Nocardioides halotolerans]|uniref:lytic transglycosylase domain-containing protein n=1 Tax=Nocardioides halotolerans TaxID=433660 RepID=UPI00048FBC2F|nr:transglycosylase SLT domain-containing protein [Nocardioides halotolerans]